MKFINAALLALSLSFTLLPGTAIAGLNEGIAAYDKGDFSTALREFEPLAAQGDAIAQYALGTMYDEGKGVSIDYSEAFKWFTHAANKGDNDAQARLGSMYEKGEGTVPDYKKALKWYRLAADQGNAIAQSNLGAMYANGQGAAQDDKEAVKLFRLAADQGNAIAQFNLGKMYYVGQGVAQNYNEAEKWSRLAATQGNANAQYALGWLYDTGQGVPQDTKEAMKWYRLSDAQGNVNAWNRLSKLEKESSASSSNQVAENIPEHYNVEHSDKSKSSEDGKSLFQMFFWFILIGVASASILGLLPAFIAKNKGRNFTLWWLYGSVLFFIAFIHSLLIKADSKSLELQAIASGGKKCPYCAEVVKAEAIVCRYCQKDLAPPPQIPSTPS